MSWLNADSKTQMRLNVLRHRQKLFKLLENINDTTLKPRILFDPTDFDKLMGKPIKTEPISNDVKIKKEPTDQLHNSADDLISVGSNEEWKNPQPVVSKVVNRRKLRRFISIPYSYEHPSNTLADDHIYASDPVEENPPILKKRLRSPPPIVQRTRTRPRETFNRVKHNAKERACRDEIAKMFITLRDICCNLNSNRRSPSKQSILVAAKLECDGLKHSEKKLIAEKKKLRAVNITLVKNLKMMNANACV